MATKPKPPCRHYRRGNCKYGRKGVGCPFPHPKECMKFVKHGFDSKTGCNEGRRCKAFHPVMCKYSLHKKVCTNPDCRYPHIKGTRRTQPTQEAPQHGSSHHPGPHNRKEVADNSNCPTARETTPTEMKSKTESENPALLGNLTFLGNRVEMLASQQEQLQNMLARLMDQMGRPEPYRKRCCSFH